MEVCRMRKFKLFNRILFRTALLFTLIACRHPGIACSSDQVVTIDFWAKPNPTQEIYWKAIAEQFEQVHDHIRIHVTQMQETPSSEAGILTALASGSAPTLSENISRSFAAQLAESGAIIPLNEFAFYSKCFFQLLFCWFLNF